MLLIIRKIKIYLTQTGYNIIILMSMIKKFIILILFTFFCTVAALATDINYGYNAHGDYVPTSYGGQQIQYGYNAHGDYVQTSIGGQQIQYGYNAHGNYVPTSIGGQKIQYGYNSHGDYVPKGIGY